MNPITQTKNLMKINDQELEMGVAGTKNSWHQEYKVSDLPVPVNIIFLPPFVTLVFFKWFLYKVHVF